MPVDISNRPFYGRGGPGGSFLSQRYSPLPPLHEVPRRTSPFMSTEVRLTGRGKAQVQPSASVPPSVPVLSQTRGGQRPPRSPINRPCMRFKTAVSPPSPRRYRKLTDSDAGDDGGRRGVGGGLLRAVANRGRGYEDLRCRGAGGNPPDSGGSSPASSPRVSPNVSPRAPQSGILITSAIAKSGIKRLSRVSFGSSKGSMVETLIYDSPVAEEDRIPEEESLITDPVAQKLGSETGEPHKPASRVRVTFFESEKPLAVTSPEPPDLHSFSSPLFDLTMTSPPPNAVPPFDRQLSTESGRDNPFRPDGDISKEADEIVQLIKSGRPLEVTQQPHITGDEADTTTVTADAQHHLHNSSANSPTSATKGAEVHEPFMEARNKGNSESQPAALQHQYPSPTSAKGATNRAGGVNGSAAAADTSPGPVEIKHATVTPSEPAQVEHVVLKKKNKCSCCVIQ